MWSWVRSGNGQQKQAVKEENIRTLAWSYEPCIAQNHGPPAPVGNVVAQPAEGQKVEALLVVSSKVELPNYRTCSASFSCNDQRNPPLCTHAALQPEQNRQTLNRHRGPPRAQRTRCLDGHPSDQSPRALLPLDLGWVWDVEAARCQITREFAPPQLQTWAGWAPSELLQGEVWTTILSISQETQHICKSYYLGSGVLIGMKGFRFQYRVIGWDRCTFYVHK